MGHYRTHYRLGHLGGRYPKVTQTNLAETHFPMMDLNAPTLENVFLAMQGETWSPNGEAKPLLDAAGVCHTSLTVGDVIEDLCSGAFYKVTLFGFSRIF